MNILILVADFSLRGGGERVAANIANYLSGELNHQVAILSIHTISSKPGYPLDSKVSVQSLESGYSVRFFGKLSGKFRSLEALRLFGKKNNFDQAIGIGTYPSSLLGFCPGIASTRIGTEHMSFRSIPAVWAFIRRVAYRSLDTVVFLTQHDESQYGKRFRNSVVIPNFRSFFPTLPADMESRQVLNVGRLEHQKNQAALVLAFSSIAKKYPTWKLRILGDGSLRPVLQRQIESLGLSNQIELAHGTSEIVSEYLNSSLFVLTSRAEGFPMSLLEAQACGVPMVSVDCKTGPKEIITDGEDGYIVPQNDQSALTEKMTVLMSDNNLRERMSKNARELSERFAQETISLRWKSLIEG